MEGSSRSSWRSVATTSGCSAPTLSSVLFTPDRHEPLGRQLFGEAAAREAIARIAERAEWEIDPTTGRWPLEPANAISDGDGPASGLYCGGAGVIWALGELADAGYVPHTPRIVDRELAEALEERRPDDPDAHFEGVWSGLAGVLAAAEHRWPEAARRDRIAELADASLSSPTLEVMQGHPGFMALAAQLHRRTSEERWAAFWSAGAERLFAEW